MSNLFSIVPKFVTGLVFGVCLEKSKVYLPHVILQQMQFSNFLMMKVFLSATAVGMFSFSILEILQNKKRKCEKDALGTGWFGGYGGNIIGGTLIGMGMTISGACPGTNLIQIGAGVPNSTFVYLGQLVAALTFGLSFCTLKNATNQEYKKKRPSPLLDQLLSIPYPLISAIGAALLFGGIAGISTFISSDVADFAKIPTGFIPTSAWPPLYAGCLIGALQLVYGSICSMSLGNSTAYMYATSLVATKLPISEERCSHFKGKADLGSSQLIQQIGMISGAALSTYLAPSFLPGMEPTTTTPLSAFLGGFILLFGARLADGCPSGHGLTGMAQMSIASFLTVGFMFIGGMGLASFLPTV